MVIRIIVAGETQCELFAEISLVADYLDQQLPCFCYETIEKTVLEWPSWLCKVNQKNGWHHDQSPLVWKELLIKGSKPYYIGGASEFLEYCHSYYNFDLFMSTKVFGSLVKCNAQYKKKLKNEENNAIKPKMKKTMQIHEREHASKSELNVCIYGAAYGLSMHLISELLNMSRGGKCVSRIYIYDDTCSPEFMQSVENECSFIGTHQAGKVVKYVDKIGVALTNSDMLIILHHIPFNAEMSIGEWLQRNQHIMHDLANMINACASRNMYLLFANLGPASFNATILREAMTANKDNVVVVCSGLGLDTVPAISEIYEIPMRNIFCPPVWGFTGINHIVDIRNTIHKYSSFEPYNRYTRVKNSTLTIGSVTPEMRQLEYLLYFDEAIWPKVIEMKSKIPKDLIHINKAVALLNVVKLWLFEPNLDAIVNLGVACNGSFGLTFEGIFAQPSRFKNGKWQPASDYPTPKDPYVKIYYLQYMARKIMAEFRTPLLPPLVPFRPCSCKTKYRKKKGVW